MADKAHAMRDKAKTFPELTFFNGCITRLVNLIADTARSDGDPRLILNKPDFVQQILHKLCRLTEHGHSRHIGKISMTIASGVERQHFTRTPRPTRRGSAKLQSAGD